MVLKEELEAQVKALEARLLESDERAKDVARVAKEAFEKVKEVEAVKQRLVDEELARQEVQKENEGLVSELGRLMKASDSNKGQ